MQSKDSGVGVLLVKVGVLNPIASIGESNTGSISAEFENAFLQCETVARALAHLLSVQEKMTICPHRPGPVFLGEERRMAVEGECEMVRDEIFAGRSDIERIEVREGSLEGVNLFSSDALRIGECRLGPGSKNVLPDLIG